MTREVRHVLGRTKFNLTADENAFLISHAYQCVRIYPDPPLKEIRIRYDQIEDKKDLPILAGFEGLECRFLVTGDREILAKVPRAIRTSSALRAIARDLQEPVTG